MTDSTSFNLRILHAISNKRLNLSLRNFFAYLIMDASNLEAMFEELVHQNISSLSQISKTEYYGCRTVVQIPLQTNTTLNYGSNVFITDL